LKLRTNNNFAFYTPVVVKGKKSKKNKGAGAFFGPPKTRREREKRDAKKESGEDKKEIAPPQKALAPRRED